VNQPEAIPSKSCLGEWLIWRQVLTVQAAGFVTSSAREKIGSAVCWLCI